MSLTMAAAVIAPYASGGGRNEDSGQARPAVPRSFTVLENYTGGDFFDGFQFFSGEADPTGGYVNYVDHDTAFKNGLAAVTADGAVLLRVDNLSTILPPPPPPRQPAPMDGSGDHVRQLQPAPPPAAPCNVENITRCEQCPDYDFWGYNGDGCDLANYSAASGAECCDLCHAHGSSCTGYTLDQHVCYLKSIDYCTPRPSPPPGVYHTCAGVMTERGQTCPGGPAAADARQSVRVSSRATFDVNTFGGADTLLVVADIRHIPSGCAVWPAFWMLGPTWPDDGEIDMIEGVNGQEYTESTLHTSPGCTQQSVPSSLFSGRRAKSTLDKNLNATDCFVHARSQGPNQGCGILGPPGSLGADFNELGGGVFATLIRNPRPMTAANAAGEETAHDKSANGVAEGGRGEIAMWFWPRSNSNAGTDTDTNNKAGRGGSIPADVMAGNPWPGGPGWGAPYALFALGDDCSVDHFTSQSLIFDTTYVVPYLHPAGHCMLCTPQS
jgi:hypothetical protein